MSLEYLYSACFSRNDGEMYSIDVHQLGDLSTKQNILEELHLLLQWHRRPFVHFRKFMCTFTSKNSASYCCRCLSKMPWYLIRGGITDIPKNKEMWKRRQRRFPDILS